MQAACRLTWVRSRCAAPSSASAANAGRGGGHQSQLTSRKQNSQRASPPPSHLSWHRALTRLACRLGGRLARLGELWVVSVGGQGNTEDGGGRKGRGVSQGGTQVTGADVASRGMRAVRCECRWRWRLGRRARALGGRERRTTLPHQARTSARSSGRSSTRVSGLSMRVPSGLVCRCKAEQRRRRERKRRGCRCSPATRRDAAQRPLREPAGGHAQPV